MGFLQNVKLPNNTAKNSTDKNSGSFLSKVKMPTPQSLKVYGYQKEAAQAAQVSKEANSFGGIMKATFANGALDKAIPNTFIGKWAINTWNIYNATPQKIVEDIKAGAEDMQKDGFVNKNKGGLKTGFRVAADTAIAIFAPLSAAIGTVLEETGGQKLTDKGGEIIADSSGITDIPAFQKFAMEHPNAGEDFNRLLMLVMLKGEKGKIDPQRILTETKNVAKRIVNSAKGNEVPTPPTPPAPKSGISPDIKTTVESPKTDVTKPIVKGGFLESVKKQGEETVAPEGFSKEDIANLKKKGFSDALIAKMEETARSQTPKETPVTSENAPKTTETTPTEVVKPTEETTIEGGVKGKSKVGLSVQESTLEKRFTDTFEGTAEYDIKTVKDQAKLTSDLINTSPEDVKSIIKGDKPLPKNINTGYFIKAMEDYALSIGDNSLIKDIMKSPLVTETSEAAQTLRFLAERDPESPIGAMSDIVKSREAIDAKQGVKSEGIKVTKDTLTKFIKGLEC